MYVLNKILPSLYVYPHSKTHAKNSDYYCSWLPMVIFFRILFILEYSHTLAKNTQIVVKLHMVSWRRCELEQRTFYMVYILYHFADRGISRG